MNEPLPCYEQLRDRVKALDDALSAAGRMVGVQRQRAERFESIIRRVQQYLAGEANALDPAPSLDWFLATEMHKITGEPIC